MRHEDFFSLSFVHWRWDGFVSSSSMILAGSVRSLVSMPGLPLYLDDQCPFCSPVLLFWEGVGWKSEAERGQVDTLQLLDMSGGDRWIAKKIYPFGSGFSCLAGDCML